MEVKNTIALTQPGKTGVQASNFEPEEVVYINLWRSNPTD